MKKVLLFLTVGLVFALLFFSCSEDDSDNENNAPSARVSANVLRGTAPLSVNFFVSANDPEGDPIVEYYIDYGDGQSESSTSPVFSHTYASPGSYLVKAKVKDSAGNWSPLSPAITVTALSEEEASNHAPTVTLAATPTSGTAPLAVSFSVLANDPENDPITEYYVDFGDGSHESSATPHFFHLYTSAGSYTVSARATDSHGNVSSTATLTVEVEGNTAPSASLSADRTNGAPPLRVSFTASATDPDGDAITQYEFDFGDGSQPFLSSLPRASHTYAGEGTFRARVRAKDSHGAWSNWSSAVEITVAQPSHHVPTATLSASPTGGTAPLTVSFTASATDPDGDAITQYEFNFGDGSPVLSSTSNTATHNYTVAGTYQAKVRAKDSTGNWSEWSSPVEINVTTTQAPPCTLSASPSTTLKGSKFLFTATCSGTNVDHYEFDFGDGETFSTPVPEALHSYHADGTYEVKVRAVTPDGVEGEWSDPVSVEAKPTWSRFFDGNSATPVSISDGAFLPDGNLVVVYKDASGANVYLTLSVRNPLTGDEIVTRATQHNNIDTVSAVGVDSATGDIYVVGLTTTPNGFVAKYSSSLDAEEWFVELANASEVHDVVPTPAGAYVCGTKENGAQNDVYFGFINSDGTVLWETADYDPSAGNDDIAYACALGEDGYLYIAGISNGDAMVLKVNPSTHGVVKSYIHDYSGNTDKFNDLIITSDDLVVVGGNANTDGLVDVLDTDLTSQLATPYTYLTGEINALAEGPNSTVLAAGETNGDVLIIKFNPHIGDAIWEKHDLAGTGTDSANFILSALSPETYILVGGSTSSSDFPTADGNTYDASAGNSAQDGFVLGLTENGTY